MCGIIGYVGHQQACSIIIDGLKQLEYRGYDSAGIAILNGDITVHKAIGRVVNLDSVRPVGLIGIGHTRWATHGAPSTKNAHPHKDCTGNIVIIHNGILENYLALKERLKTHGFLSDTDSEVFAHLIEHYFKGDLLSAVRLALKDTIGTYALCVMHKASNEVVVARNGSPLIIGLGENENFIASDIAALVNHTRRVIYLDDFEMARIDRNQVTVYDKEGNQIIKEAKVVDWDVELAEKQGYKHFMLKEILEQPKIVQDSLPIVIPNLPPCKKIFMVACGTAGYAGLVGKYLIEKLARVPVEWVQASEFRYSDPIIGPDDLFIAVSQSGETADTLAALRLAKEKGAKTLGIINVVQSTIAREADQVIYTRAGSEIGVASTKAFISQLVVLYKIAAVLGNTTIDLSSIPNHISAILLQSDSIRKIAKKYFRVYNFMYIGRNLNYPIAMEGALKLKEISYIHAEGYASGEMKHGPIALVTDDVPTVAIVPQDAVYSKVISNIQEAKAREGHIIAIATEGDTEIAYHADDIIFIPKVDELLTPLLTTIAVQLLAYHIADLRGCDIDKPRNLAKSVTVE